MDHLPHFRSETEAFAAAAAKASSGPAPIVPSCPQWSVSDLVLHLGRVHRLVTAVIDERLTQPAGPSAPGTFELVDGWPDPLTAPNLGPLPAGLVDWFTAGAAALADRFTETDPSVPVWTWSAEQSVGFWLRMQTIEAAIHRWDLEQAIGPGTTGALGAAGGAAPLPSELAADAVAQTFEVMAPARRAWHQAPAASGERLTFRRTDGPGRWTAVFEGGAVRLDDTSVGDVEAAGTASDLALFLWQRIPAHRLAVSGDQSVLDRYFTLVPPV